MSYHSDLICEIIKKFNENYNLSDVSVESFASFLEAEGVFLPKFKIRSKAAIVDMYDTVNNCSKISDGSGSRCIEKRPREVYINSICKTSSPLLYRTIPVEITDTEKTSNKTHYIERSVFESEIFSSVSEVAEIEIPNNISPSEYQAKMCVSNKDKIVSFLNNKKLMDVSFEAFLNNPSLSALFLFNNGFMASKYKVNEEVYIYEKAKPRKCFITEICFDSPLCAPDYYVQPFETSPEEDEHWENCEWSSAHKEWMLST